MWTVTCHPHAPKGTEYYRGDLFGNEVEGNSKVVAMEVRDTVSAMLPSLMRVFFSSENVVEFAPRGPEDTKMAQQATDYCNYIYQNDNSGFLTTYAIFKDALVREHHLTPIVVVLLVLVALLHPQQLFHLPQVLLLLLLLPLLQADHLCQITMEQREVSLVDEHRKDQGLALAPTKNLSLSMDGKRFLNPLLMPFLALTGFLRNQQTTPKPLVLVLVLLWLVPVQQTKTPTCKRCSLRLLVNIKGFVICSLRNVQNGRQQHRLPPNYNWMT